MSKISTKCEFELKLVNYDLIGREAIATQNFIFNPLPEKLLLNNNVYSFKKLIKQNQFIFIIMIIFVSLIIPLLIVFFVIKTCELCRWKKKSSSLNVNENVGINNLKKLSTHTIIDV